MQSIVSLCLDMMHNITRLMNMIYSETVISQNINFMCHIRCFRPETIEKNQTQFFFNHSFCNRAGKVSAECT